MAQSAFEQAQVAKEAVAIRHHSIEQPQGY
jgi:hypothetical protein